LKKDPRGYLELSRTATYGFLAALPLFLLYESLVLFVNAGRVSQVRVGADVWIKQLLGTVGGTGMFSLGLLVLAIGIAVFVRERKKDIPIVPSWFGLMIGESLIYAIGVAIIVSSLVGLLFAITPPQAAGIDRGTMLVLSIGAGLYEELIFRVVLVGGLFVLMRTMVDQKIVSYSIAAVIGAFIFSAVHYIGPLGDAFTMPSFMFRLFFGLALNVLFLLRGFGVAAWTHALYDVLVVTELLG